MSDAPPPGQQPPPRTSPPPGRPPVGRHPSGAPPGNRMPPTLPPPPARQPRPPAPPGESADFSTPGAEPAPSGAGLRPAGAGGLSAQAPPAVVSRTTTRRPPVGGAHPPSMPPRPPTIPPPLRQRTGRPGAPSTSVAVPIRVPPGQTFAAFTTGTAGGPARFDAPGPVRVGSPAGAADRVPSGFARRRGGGLRPANFRLTQLVMIELGLALGVVGLVSSPVLRIVCWVLAAVLIVPALVPVRGRWLYQALVSNAGLVRRRGAQRRGAGLAALFGPFSFTTVRTLGDAEVGALHVASTWTIALEIGTDDLFNDDPPVPVGDLGSLLTIEDVSLASVRLLTAVSPPTAGAGPSPGAGDPSAGLARAATRVLLLTLDTGRAATALASRGGTQAAIEQILRRCALRAEEQMRQSGLDARALDEAGLRRLVDACLGPAAPHDPQSGADEQRSGVIVGGTVSATVSVPGVTTETLAGLERALPHLPAAVAVSTVMATRGATGSAVLRSLVRISAPAVAETNVRALADALGAVTSRVGVRSVLAVGDQARALALTTPFGSIAHGADPGSAS